MGLAPGILDASRTINGSYGTVYIDGKWATNFNELEANVEIQKGDVRPAGSRWVFKKITGLAGTGTIRGYKVTSELIQKHTGTTSDDRSKPYYTEIIAKLDDPEAYGHERVRLKNVIFDKIELTNFKPGEIVPTEWPFTFSDYELLDPIVAG